MHRLPEQVHHRLVGNLAGRGQEEVAERDVRQRQEADQGGAGQEWHCVVISLDGWLGRGIVWS